MTVGGGNEGADDSGSEGTGSTDVKKRFLGARSFQRQRSFRHDCLRNCALFATCDPKFLDRVMEELTVELYQRGEVILMQGEEGDTTYVLNRGEVEVLVGPNMDTVATLSSGSVFGEMTLLGVSNTRSSTIRALEFCDCRVIHHGVFMQILRIFPHEQAFFKEIAEKRRREADKCRGGGAGDAPKDPRATKSLKQAYKRRLSTLTGKPAESFDPGLCSVFSGRSPAFLVALMACFKAETFLPEDYIVEQGQKGDTMYFLHRGEVEVLVGPEQMCVATLSTGAVFGEMVLMGIHCDRTSTVRATDDCDCRVITREDFKAIVHDFPEEEAYFKELAEQRKGSLESMSRTASEGEGVDTVAEAELDPLSPADDSDSSKAPERTPQGGQTLPRLLGQTSKLQQLMDSLLRPKGGQLTPFPPISARGHSRWRAGQLQEVTAGPSSAEEDPSAWRRPAAPLPELPPSVQPTARSISSQDAPRWFDRLLEAPTAAQPDHSLLMAAVASASCAPTAKNGCDEGDLLPKTWAPAEVLRE